jgi:hypothetical protein
VALASVALGSSAAAQTVRVRAVEAETNRSVAGAIVRLVDIATRAVSQGLTSETGNLLLRAPAPGRYRLRADRIGHLGTWTEEFTVADTVSVTVVLPLDRVDLPEIAVTGATSCTPRPDGAETATLWDEVRKALTAEVITAASQETERAVRRFRQSRTMAGVLESDSTVAAYRTTASPFVSPPMERLAREGFIISSGGGFQFHGPDARTLLEPAFLETHCYLVSRHPTDSTLIGLGFAPTREVKKANVRGVLWVDRATSQLESLEFEYVNVPRAARAPGIGGRVEFERLATGTWIVRDWHIRAPRRRPTVRQLGRHALTRDTLVGYLDQGGSARPVEEANLLLLGEAAARVRGSTTFFGDLAARVIDPDGKPVAGASVATTATDSILTTDRRGRFEIKDVPVGRLGIRIRMIGFRPFGISLTISAERRSVDTTFRLVPAAQVLDSVVVAAKADTFVAGRMLDVERRRQAGFGKFLGRAELKDPLGGGLDSRLRRFARLRLVPLCNGLGVAAASSDPSGATVDIGCAAACFMTVYLDGLLFWSPEMMGATPPDLGQFSPQTLEAVEIYPNRAVIPIEFTGRLAPCGVILLWTALRN